MTRDYVPRCQFAIPLKERLADIKRQVLAAFGNNSRDRGKALSLVPNELVSLRQASKTLLKIVVGRQALSPALINGKR